MTALIAAVSTALLNSFGRIAAFLFSWAMVGFFGKMPPKRQYILAGIGLMSILWTIFLVSIFLPQITQFLFLLNKGLENPRVKEIISRFSLIFVFVLPLLIGLASLFVDNKPPETLGGKAIQILKGFVIAPGFAVGIVLMMITSVITIAVTYLKRIQTQHVPIQLQEGGYERVINDIKDALNKNNFPVRETELPIYLKPPVMVMGFLAKSIVQGLVTPGAKMLRNDSGLYVILHPTDMIVAGPKTTANQARAIITQRVPFTDAYLTWEPETQKFEDKVASLWRKWKDEPHPSDVKAGDEQIRARLKQIEELKEQLHSVDVSFEQWEVVYRELLQLQDEVVSGRVQRGDSPSKSSASDVDSAESAVGALSNNASSTRSNAEKEKRAGQSILSAKPAWTELALIGALVLLWAQWRNRD